MTDDRNSPPHEDMKAKLRTLEIGPPEKPLKDAFESLASRDVLSNMDKPSQNEGGSGVDDVRDGQAPRESDQKQAN